MAKKDTEEQEPLTEEQRISALESKVGINKLVLLVMALILIIVISVSITLFSINALSGDDEKTVSITMLAELETKISVLQEENSTQASQIQQLKKQFPLLEEQVASSSNKKLQAIVIAQEKSHQEFLDALRSGMYDLAHMVPGSRTWLDVYGEKIDLATAHSKSREKDLEKLGKSSDNPDEEEDPFADGF
jgi:TolA-binding protein